MQKAGKGTTSGGDDGGAARKVMHDNKQACTKLGWVSTEQVTIYIE